MSFEEFSMPFIVIWGSSRVKTSKQWFLDFLLSAIVRSSSEHKIQKEISAVSISVHWKQVEVSGGDTFLKSDFWVCYSRHKSNVSEPLVVLVLVTELTVRHWNNIAGMYVLSPISGHQEIWQLYNRLKMWYRLSEVIRSLNATLLSKWPIIMISKSLKEIHSKKA